MRSSPIRPESSNPSWAIENWITGPFHRMWLLNPALHQVGYGQYCEKGICAAALNIHSGADGTADVTTPVMFPADRSTISQRHFHSRMKSSGRTRWPVAVITLPPGYR